MPVRWQLRTWNLRPGPTHWHIRIKARAAVTARLCDTRGQYCHGVPVVVNGYGYEGPACSRTFEDQRFCPHSKRRALPTRLLEVRGGDISQAVATQRPVPGSYKRPVDAVWVVEAPLVALDAEVKPRHGE